MVRLHTLFLWPLFITVVFPAVSYSQSQPGTPPFFFSDQPEESYVHEHYHSVANARAEYELRY
ncbi:MAG: hypothetical protein ACNA8K_02885 [Cyclonatronaceae bacterium]